MICYESCKWYVKLWRQRWYLYAILLHLKNFININYWIDLLMDNELDDENKKSLKSKWYDIKHHVELSKMCKFSTIYDQEKDPF